ncbi:MAG TPA: FKBP-type peptidyl-prolyl cis-trans isomerase [Pseudomonadota bacterium]|jgi:peptidylprolyl isomerase|nr:FKBP-type peptidyl-prolyl cis-trans isomerase [Pseudomonadota bacterium]HNI59029.1 FKBP-type peptidyl-prolyl cis-trans isomerase [Pseudomonadota bacterium]HNK46495.1 FKBP-type peptidyl-prolyl cis-trans isomerase [Pseudomonadota bacterium]HNN49610.1 FKBP-type peptidyl-prolyl cis-trans isomerase [Pseudomonadota bacterium]
MRTVVRFALFGLLCAAFPTVGFAEEKPPEAAKPALPDLPAPPDVKAPPADGEKSKTGLVSKLLAKGTGSDHPTAGCEVKVRYSGWMTDGKLFDTSEKKGAGFVAQFPIDLLIKGWQEGLKLMVVGEKRRMWIPAELAYGDTPRRPGGPHGMLVFDVELVDIVAAPAKPGKKGKK